MVLVSATSAVPTCTPRRECAGSRKYFDTGWCVGDDWRNMPDMTHLLWVKIAFLDCPTSRWLAASLFTRPAGGDSGVAAWRLPTCGRVPRGSPADAPPARPSA